MLPGVCRRSHVNHRDGQRLRCGEESHAVQTSAHRHSRVCYGRYNVYFLYLCTNRPELKDDDAVFRTEIVRSRVLVPLDVCGVLLQPMISLKTLMIDVFTG